MPDDRTFAGDQARALVLKQERFLGYATRAVRDKGLRVNDPHTGRETAPFDSVVVQGRTIYSFGDRELSMLITAGESKRLAGLLLAGANVVVDLGAELERYFTGHRLAAILSTMLRRVARMSDHYAAAITCDLAHDAPRSVAVVVGSAQNFAHHLWNYYPGLERITEEGLTEQVDEIRVAGTEFYGPITHLFPEFADTPVVRDEPGGLRDPHPFSPGHLLVQPGGVFVRGSLRARVVAAMRRLPPQQDTSPGPEPSHVAAAPIVWIGLRVGSRSWIGQDEILPRIIDRVHDLWPDALTVLDGYSFPVGRDDISDQWAPQIALLAGLAETIRGRVRRPDRVLSLVGNTLRESVLWASRAHAYLTPLGTSQHKVGWFTDAPGVVYAPPSLETVDAYRRPGSWESEGSTVPVYVFGSPREGTERRSLTDARRHLDNIALDADVVEERLLEAIAKGRFGPAESLR